MENKQKRVRSRGAPRASGPTISDALASRSALSEAPAFFLCAWLPRPPRTSLGASGRPSGFCAESAAADAEAARAGGGAVRLRAPAACLHYYFIMHRAGRAPLP